MALESSNECEGFEEALVLTMFSYCAVWQKEGMSEALGAALEGLNAVAVSVCRSKGYADFTLRVESAESYMKSVLKFQNVCRVEAGQPPLIET